MALVMLPCDLPWWPAVVKHLDRVAASKNSRDLVGTMQTLHDMCNISLDPEEDEQDPTLFRGLATFLDTGTENGNEREDILTKTIPYMVERAKALRSCKPSHGLHFSLRQQGDCVEYSYAFVSSLIANAFFSTYPKRTAKTHPTLQDFNFTNFFKHLHTNGQRAKLRSIFRYYDYLATSPHALDGKLIVSRQVMTSKYWLTVEDWLESDIPLCPLTIRHEGRLERIEPATKFLRVCFASAKLGSGVLDGDVTQETVHIATHPEMLAAILSIEALEDNEVLMVEGVRHVSRINDPRNRAVFEAVSKPSIVTVCCIDPEDYSRLPLSQFEEDNILRELNKSLLGFRQRRVPNGSTDPPPVPESDPNESFASRRLSPIGESFGGTPPRASANVASSSVNDASEEVRAASREDSGGQLHVPAELYSRRNGNVARTPSPPSRKPSNDGRNRFIVLGSSGEVLPVTRKHLSQTSIYGSCNSQSTDSFHSAKDTVDEEPAADDDDDEARAARAKNTRLETPEQRGTFAQRLREALKRENTAGATSSSDASFGESSYAVGISVSGSRVYDQDIEVKRGGSRGFVLRDETVDEDLLLKESLVTERKWLDRFRRNQTILRKTDTSASSGYSFSTEYNSDFSSELEEVYEQLARWLEDPVTSNESRELDARDKAVVEFAGSLLKRALSESLAGVPVQEGEPQLFIDSTDINQSHKLALAVRSLSLELARQKNRRQPSVPGDGSLQTGNLLPVATGNWGCGSRLKGDPQLKLVVQWLAASMARVPKLLYCTAGHPSLSKLDTVTRVLMDRHWSVGDLAAATLTYALRVIREKTDGTGSLFEEIIGMDKPSR